MCTKKYASISGARKQINKRSSTDAFHHDNNKLGYVCVASFQVLSWALDFLNDTLGCVDYTFVIFDYTFVIFDMKTDNMTLYLGVG